MLARIEADLPYFIESGLISVKQGEEALETSRKLCAEIAPLSMDLIDAFGLPEEVLAAPIASGMVTNAIPFYFPSYVMNEKTIDLPGGHISMTPRWGKSFLFCSSQQLPRLRLRPLKGFFS